jgi:hypothetical protein
MAATLARRVVVGWVVSVSAQSQASFEGRRVFPLNFLCKHYPVRSQQHGMRKVFRDRIPRYTAEELSAGWHGHYAQMQHGVLSSFLHDRDSPSLAPFGPSFYDERVLERLARAGIGHEE